MTSEGFMFKLKWRTKEQSLSHTVKLMKKGSMKHLFMYSASVTAASG